MPAYNFACFLVEKLFMLQTWALEVATTGNGGEGREIPVPLFLSPDHITLLFSLSENLLMLSRGTFLFCSVFIFCLYSGKYIMYFFLTKFYHIYARSQYQDKWLTEVLLVYQRDLAALCLTAVFLGTASTLPPTLSFSSPGKRAWLSFPSCSSLYNPAMLATRSFWPSFGPLPSWPLSLVLLFPALSPPSSRHVAGSVGRSRSVLTLLEAWLCSPFIYNKPRSSHGLPFSFFFFSFNL